MHSQPDPEWRERPSLSSEGRMLSLDALRGFNMLWIIGVEQLVWKLHEIYATPFTAALNKQLLHPSWDEGFTFFDLIWPLFLFIVGVAMPVSLRRRRDAGASRPQLYFYIARRTFVVFMIGVLVTGPLRYSVTSLWDVSWWGVLQRIAVCYFVAAILVLHTGSRPQAAVCIVILLGYWAALMSIEINGYGPGVASREECWVYAFGLSDNFVTTPLSLPSVLLGVWAGDWLHSQEPDRRKVVGLTLSGLALLVVAYAWSFSFPMIKRIWSSTYVIYAGGWSLLLLALFYWLIDVKGYRKWAFFFVVIGMNPLLIYALTHGHVIIDFEWIAKLFLQGLIDHAGWTQAQPVLLIAGAVVLRWLFLWFLYRKRIFLHA